MPFRELPFILDLLGILGMSFFKQALACSMDRSIS